MTRPENPAAGEEYVTLHIPSKYVYLRTVRQLITDACNEAGMSEFNTAQLEMAVDESCSNIIEHGYGGESEAGSGLVESGIRINVVEDAGRIVVELYDRGTGFEFEEFQVLNPDEYLEEGHNRGLGMYIIKRFIGEISYEQNGPRGNVLKLVKRT